MSKLYLISHSSEYDRDKIITLLNKGNKISFWFYNLPYSFFIKTTLTPKEICEFIIANFGKKKIFITELKKDSYYGYIPAEHWKYFKQ